MTHSKNVKKIPYKGYTVKEKWLPSLLLSLFAPLTLCFFGPFEIYGNNMGEFKFVLWDFWLLCALVAFGAAAVIFALLMLVRGRVFDVCFGLVFGLSLMLFLQGNYLSMGLGALSGDGVGEEITSGQVTLNLIIWLVVLAGCIAAMVILRAREIARLVYTVGSLALVGMTLISFLVISLTTDVYTTHKTDLSGEVIPENEVLTTKNLDTLAEENNIVIFIVDRFDHTYFDEAMESCPEIFDALEGFTHFDDYTTLYPRTYPGVIHLVTGVEPDFALPRLQFMQAAYQNSPYLAELKAMGFDINVYTDDYYGYENATHMRQWVSNTSGNIDYQIVKKNALSMDMIRVSLYRYLPFSMRESIGEVSTTMYEQYVSYELEKPLFTTDMKDVYNALTDGEFTFRDAKKGLSYIHIAGCHLPNAYGPDFGEVKEEERYDSNVSLKQSFAIISAYLEEMKRMGVYESSTILILGDHCSIGSDSKLPYKAHVTTLLAKPAGVGEGEMVTRATQISTNDVFATVLDAAGSDKAWDYGENIWEIPEDQNRSRTYYFQQYVEGSYRKNAVYQIVGNGNDFENWILTRVDDLPHSIYD